MDWIFQEVVHQPTDLISPGTNLSFRRLKKSESARTHNEIIYQLALYLFVSHLIFRPMPKRKHFLWEVIPFSFNCVSDPATEMIIVFLFIFYHYSSFSHGLFPSGSVPAHNGALAPYRLLGPRSLTLLIIIQRIISNKC